MDNFTEKTNIFHCGTGTLNDNNSLIPLQFIFIFIKAILCHNIFHCKNICCITYRVKQHLTVWLWDKDCKMCSHKPRL